MGGVSAKVDKRGQITIPAEIRKSLKLEDDSLVIIELTDEGILIKPAIVTPVTPEEYTQYRVAEFLLNNAVGNDDYQQARQTVEEMGLDPDEIAHDKPC
ncbi:MAG TPA: AbrB/MazE/SpoVT family DNA-binding domain-containing protein [Phycisphaerales bacterium]|nr:AbrB/MazE/SpoVT family DNA-binding domain-containing protein [Phycisphaerales bacterium]